MYPTDDYIWLGERPVAITRGRFSTSWARQYDFGSTGCSRNGDGSACGVYFPVTDAVGKPVLMLDSTRRVAGEADYNPFGHPNRVFMDAESAHPYPFNGTTPTIADVTPTSGSPALALNVRGRYAVADTYAVGLLCSQDNIELYDANASAVLWYTAGIHLGQVVTPWKPLQLSSGNGHLQVLLQQNSTHTQPSICFPSICCIASSPPAQYYGVVVDSYEFQRYQVGSTPFWTPVRFPGHYYDAETDLSENWNRYYDPSIGSYFQPEPLMSRAPGYYGAVAAQYGTQPNPYAYAASNPLGFVDPTGRAQHLQMGDRAAEYGEKYYQTENVWTGLAALYFWLNDFLGLIPPGGFPDTVIPNISVPFVGFEDWGRDVCKWGKGPGAAVARSTSITPAEAQALDPSQVSAAQQFYEKAAAAGKGLPSSAERSDLMRRILELQNK